MKKLFAILVVAVFTLGLVACGGKEASSATSSKPAASSAPAKSESAMEEAAVEEEDMEEDVEEGTDEMSDVLEYLLTNATVSLLGVTDSGEDVVFLSTPDMAIIAFVNEDGQSVSFVGPYEENDTQITIMDEAMGASFTMELVEMYDDGSFVADMGDLGQIAFEVTDVETAVTAFALVSELSEAVA